MRSQVGFIDLLVLTEVWRVSEEEVLFHFCEDRNLSREFTDLRKVLRIVCTNLPIFMQSLYLGLLWASFSEKNFHTFQEIPIIGHILQNVKSH